MKRGTADLSGGAYAEYGSMNTFREAGNLSGKTGIVDYSASVSRLDTDNDRPNNEYRSTSAVANFGINPTKDLRVFTLLTYSLADTGNPNSIFTPRLRDNLLTERWLIGPGIEYKPFAWWKHRLVTDYDEERQVNDPNEDGFVGPTRALFRRFQLDYQNEIAATRWLKITTGFFYSRVDAEQKRPFVAFGAPLIEDKTENEAAFLQLQFEPIKNLLLVAGGRYNHFNQFGDQWTYRLAGSYRIEKTGTVLRTSWATGFTPPSSQDKIFGNNFDLDPNKTRGFDVGFEQSLLGERVHFGANYFHNNLTNVIGFNGLFETLNLGSARTQGVEVFLSVNPVEALTLSANYTYLDTEKTSDRDISQPLGSRLPRRPRNELSASASYLWFGKLRTGVEVKYVNAREELNFGGPNFDIEDYTTVRLIADYEVTRNLKIIGRIENLTDQKYAEVFGYPNPGRAYYGGLNFKF
jgi:vitamin B12 transporter